MSTDNPPPRSHHKSLFNAVNTVIQPNQDRSTNGRTHTRIINLHNIDVLLASKREDRLFRTVSFLHTLDPIRGELNRDLAPWRSKRGTVHATAELITRLDYHKVCDLPAVSLRAARTPATPPPMMSTCLGLSVSALEPGPSHGREGRLW